MSIRNTSTVLDNKKTYFNFTAVLIMKYPFYYIITWSCFLDKNQGEQLMNHQEILVCT